MVDEIVSIVVELRVPKSIIDKAYLLLSDRERSLGDKLEDMLIDWVENN